MATLKVRRDYPTIQAAVNAAAPGDCILVENGVYYEEVNISTSDIRIVGGKCTALDGDFTRGFCFSVNGASRVSIEGFLMKSCTGNGVQFLGGGENTLESCQILDCYGNGVYLDATSFPRIRNCIISANGENGAALINCDGGEIGGCRIESCKNGVYIEQELPRLFNIIDNDISRNFMYGILAGSSPVNVEKNCLAANAEAAIFLTGPGSVLKCNNVGNNFSDGIVARGEGCSLSDNQVLANEGTGVTVSRGCRVFGNVCSRNRGDGILITGDNNTVEGNQCIDNERYDIARLLPNNIIRSNLYRSSNPRRISTPPCPG